MNGVTDMRLTAFPKRPSLLMCLEKTFQTYSTLRTVKVLELGAGSGDFVHAFNKLFPTVDITAVDMNVEGAPNYEGLKCTLVNSDVSKFTASCKEKFDIIFMFDVIEHMRDPLELLGNCSRLLNPGARVCITTPLANSGLHRMTGRFWPQYKVEHLFYLSEKVFRVSLPTDSIFVLRVLWN